VHDLALVIAGSAQDVVNKSAENRTIRKTIPVQSVVHPVNVAAMQHG
jgi:hypothetical protein